MGELHNEQIRLNLLISLNTAEGETMCFWIKIDTNEKKIDTDEIFLSKKVKPECDQVYRYKFKRQ